MTESIPVSLLEGWINELRSGLKQEGQVAKTDRDSSISQGMRHGLVVIWHKITTWLRHQANEETLKRSGQRILITKDVSLSRGRYRKLEWYEGDLFVTLAWRHRMYSPIMRVIP